MRKTLLILIIGFILGYTSHAYLPRTGVNLVKTLAPETASKSETVVDPFLTTISYRDGKFKPDSVNVKTGNYLIIVNNSDSLMWLTSNNPLLTTTRGYGRSEQVRIRADDEGVFTVTNKLNIKARTVITVSP